jgi:integrase
LTLYTNCPRHLNEDIEVLSIQVKNIDFANQIIYLPKAKPGAREQHIIARLADFLEERMKSLEAGQEFLFPAKKPYRQDRSYMMKPFKRAEEEAGLKAVPNTMRHRAITQLVQAGVNLPTAQRISDHKNLEMVAKYAHQNGKHIKKVLDKLERRYKAV